MRTTSRDLAPLRFLAPLLLLAPVSAQATIQGLGASGSRAFGMSSDGQYVTGTSPNGLFLWNSVNGSQIVATSPFTGEPDVNLAGTRVSGTWNDISTGMDTAGYVQGGTMTFLPGATSARGDSASSST